MTMSTGIYTWFGFFEPFETRLQEISAAGFDGVTLWWEDEGGDAPCPRRRMKTLAESYGLQVYNAHMAGLDSDELYSDSVSARRQHIDSVKQTIEEMADEGLHHLVLHVCERIDGPPPGALLLGGVEELLQCAESNRTLLSFENTWRADYLDAIFREFPSPFTGFCYDSSHAQLRHHESLLADWGKLLTACHLSDNDLVEDRHYLPFDGQIDFAPLLPPLLAADMPYTLEVIADRSRYHDGAEFAVTARERLLRLIGDGHA